MKEINSRTNATIKLLKTGIEKKLIGIDVGFLIIKKLNNLLTRVPKKIDC